MYGFQAWICPSKPSFCFAWSRMSAFSSIGLNTLKVSRTLPGSTWSTYVQSASSTNQIAPFCSPGVQSASPTNQIGVQSPPLSTNPNTIAPLSIYLSIYPDRPPPLLAVHREVTPPRHRLRPLGLCGVHLLLLAAQ